MALAYAPASVEILGNHTDYNEGLALTCALQHGVQIEGAASAGGRVTLQDAETGRSETFSIDQIQKNPATSWANDTKAVIQQLLKYKIPVAGFEAVIRHDLPPFLNLQSGSMLSVASVMLIRQLFPFEAQPGLLAKICRDAEIANGNSYCGLLGPLTSLAAVKNSVLFIDFRTLEAHAIAFPPTHRFVLCDSGSRNLLVNAKMKIRHGQCKDAMRSIGSKAPGANALRDVNPIEMQRLAGEMNEYVFRTAMHVTTENQRVREAVEALSQGDINTLADRMNHSHSSCQHSIESSTPQLDLLVELARSLPGCLASKLTGYGFGGMTISLVAADHADGFASELARTYSEQSGKAAEPVVINLS